MNCTTVINRQLALIACTNPKQHKTLVDLIKTTYEREIKKIKAATAKANQMRTA